MSPRVSVVMAAYQAERTIGAAISSVLSQTYDDFEIVVCDDGSTDRTTTIAAAHPRVTVVRQENAGCGAARDRAIAEASGELIAIVDADDILLPRHLAALVDAYDRHPGTIATADFYFLDVSNFTRGRRRYSGTAFPSADAQRLTVLQQNFVSIMALFPRVLVEEIGGFGPWRRCEDWYFWMRAIFAGWRVTLQPEPLSLYRLTPGSLSADRDAMEEAEAAALRSIAARDDLTAGERAYLARRLSGPGPLVLARDADRALSGGRYAEAARLYGRAAELCPSQRALVLKARLMRAAPPLTGPLLRAYHAQTR